MAQPQIDANAFHQFEHDGWQQASDDYHRFFGSLTSQTIGPLLEAVQSRPKLISSISPADPDTFPPRPSAADGRR